jgi:hypothetical protein
VQKYRERTTNTEVEGGQSFGNVAPREFFKGKKPRTAFKDQEQDSKRTLLIDTPRVTN